MLALENIGREFGTLTALRGFSMRVVAGELVALLGPSGCGKSTALRLIAGLDAPTRGRIVWDDPAARDDLGIVFQDPTLMPWASVEDNVWLPLRLRGYSKATARPEIDAALDMVGLSGFERAVPRELSGGMRMRVSIARAVVTRPRILLMDEPFAALDEITRHRLNDDLLRLREAIGCAVVFVTHSVFESVYLADRILVMTDRPGRVAEEIEVPVGRREPAFRTSSEFAALARRTSEALAEAMGRAAA